MITPPFQSLAENYATARSQYPDRIIARINEIINAHALPSSEPKLIVDLGCGTGISTRQLVGEKRKIIGVDLDIGMLEKAIEQSPDDIEFVCCDAVSFRLDQLADVVTMFASMHWLADHASMEAIRNLIDSTGIVIAINRLDVEFRSAIFKSIAGYDSGKHDDIKTTFSHRNAFEANGFKVVSSDSITGTEAFNEELLKEYVSSMSVYNFIDDANKPKAMEAIATNLLDEDGACIRNVTFEITVAALA